jgi:glycosyltransferase involved in cell wall biosynthesis
MAHGRPVVATAVGGLPEAIRNGESGLLVPPADPHALRAAIERLLGDSELRARLGRAARKDAGQNFSWDTATATLLALYTTAARA